MSPEVEALVGTVRQLVLYVGGGSVVVVGLVTWLGQLLLGRQLQQERGAIEAALASHTHALDRRLEEYRLNLNYSLATYTARTGLLSEVQRRFTEEIWAKLFRIQWDVFLRASPLQTVQVTPREDVRQALDRQTIEQLKKLEDDMMALLELVHAGRPFLPPTLFEHLNEYCGLLREIVVIMVDNREDEADPPSGERPEAAIERRKAYRTKRDALVKQLDDLHVLIADEIRALNTPQADPEREKEV